MAASAHIGYNVWRRAGPLRNRFASAHKNPLPELGLFGAPQAAAFEAVLMLSGSVPDVLSFYLPVTAIGFSILSIALIIIFWLVIRI